MIFLGYLRFRLFSVPANKQTVEETVTSTMVERIQIDASPAPFLFIRYTMEERETKCFVL